MTEYTHLPRQCQTGTCDHAPGQCIRYRSRQCITGECGCAERLLPCGVTPAAADPDTVAPGCVLAGCGRSPADHVGWALGHLYRARLTPAEVQPPHGAEATATPPADFDTPCLGDDCTCNDIEDPEDPEDEPEQGTVAADYAPGGIHNP